MRIVSLLPSATEIVFALGLGDHLVGVSHECDYPPEAATRPAVTRSLLPAGLGQAEVDREVKRLLAEYGTIYELDRELLDRLQPDLILTQRLCYVCAVGYEQVCAAVEALGTGAHIISLEPEGLDDIFDTILTVGRAAGREEVARRLVGKLRARIGQVRARVAGRLPRPRVLALEWLDPPLAGGHWVPEMVELAGGHDLFGRPREPAVRLDWARVVEADPDVIILMPCGYDLAGALEAARTLTAVPEWEGLRAVRTGRVYAVDGSAYFNRPGPRVVDGVAVLAEVLHPDVCRGIAPPGSWAHLPLGQPVA
jgi:iron complex transport system substrate-binding protein